MKVKIGISLLTILIALFTLWTTVNAYYQQLDGDTDDDDDDDDKRLKNMKPITQFELFFSNDSDAHQTAFPNSFSINFTEFDLTFDNTFVKISSNPKFKSSNIYVIDEETREPRLYDLPSQEEHEFYREANGLGFATLVKNNLSSFDGVDFRMIGTIYLNETYNIAFDIVPVVLRGDHGRQKRRTRRDSSSADANGFHGLFRRPIEIPAPKLKSLPISFRPTSDYAEPPKGSPKKGSAVVIDNTQKPIHFNVELLVVTDLTTFNDHKRLANSDQLDVIFFHMKIYYLHLLSGVNQRYQNTFENDTDIRINITPTNFLFLTNAADQNWTLSNLTTYNGKEVLISTDTLARFKEFIESKKLPFAYDLAIGLFNKDLWSENTQYPPESRAAVSGFAYIGTVCTDHKYAVAEDFGGFSNLVTVAHEIGHNLGSYHDGEIDGYGNCTAQDNFIMTSSLSFQNSLNLLRFSPCSVNQFKKTLLNSNRDQISNVADCLINNPNSKSLSDNIDLINEELPGQIWTANDQCQMIYGPGASFCQFASNQICTLLYCRANTSTDGFCNAKVGGAMEGTTCASGKICLEGKCTESKKAATGDCLFGDEVITQQSISIPLSSPQVTCQQAFEIIEARNQSASGYCADSYFRGMCCQSCKKFDLIKCRDMFYDCPKLAKSCDNLMVNGVLVRNLCPNTCQTCPQGVAKTLTCQSNPNICQNGGACKNSSSTEKSLFAFKCVCRAGFSGDFCEEKNLCLPNPCKNGGKCLQLGSLSYACECAQNCSGLNCSSCALVTKPTSTSASKKPNKLEQITHEESHHVTITSTTTTTRATVKTTPKKTNDGCQNLNKSFCIKFRQLTDCKKDYVYLGTSLKTYCCDICL